MSAGGRIFRAHGHIAHKSNQNAWLNTLLCINGYNGTILWRRPLPEGFMIHRNTMIATPDTLYLADNKSCKRIDAATGETVDEIAIPAGLADGPVWKWMALQDNVLYALVGAEEQPITTQQSIDAAAWGTGPGACGRATTTAIRKTSFGFGRTLCGHRRADEGTCCGVTRKKITWTVAASAWGRAGSSSTARRSA